MKLRECVGRHRYGISAIVAVLGISLLGMNLGSFFARESAQAPELPTALALVPGDSFMFIRYVADLWKTATPSPKCEQFPEAGEMAKALKVIGPADLETVTLVLPSFDSLQVMNEFQTAKPKSSFEKGPPPPPVKDGPYENKARPFEKKEGPFEKKDGPFEKKEGPFERRSDSPFERRR